MKQAINQFGDFLAYAFSFYFLERFNEPLFPHL